jgi:hypothetical protein
MPVVMQREQRGENFAGLADPRITKSDGIIAGTQVISGRPTVFPANPACRTPIVREFPKFSKAMKAYEMARDVREELRNYPNNIQQGSSDTGHLIVVDSLCKSILALNGMEGYGEVRILSDALNRLVKEWSWDVELGRQARVSISRIFQLTKRDEGETALREALKMTEILPGLREGDVVMTLRNLGVPSAASVYVVYLGLAGALLKLGDYLAAERYCHQYLALTEKILRPGSEAEIPGLTLLIHIFIDQGQRALAETFLRRRARIEGKIFEPLDPLALRAQTLLKLLKVDKERERAREGFHDMRLWTDPGDY